jgi:hypothetical protein
MLTRIREQLGTAGLIVAVVALVAALTGGAIAATDGGKATSSAKAKKGPRGPKGPKGATGANGPQGPAGNPGANGKDGAPGLNGTDGTNGTNGKSVVVGTESTGTGNCGGNGGATVEVEATPASKKYACNGAPGSPWTAGGTLPDGATQTGVWGLRRDEFSLTTADMDPQIGHSIFIDFPIPLKGSIPPANIHIVNDLFGDPVPAACENTNHPGAAGVANPEATPSHMCFFGGYFSMSFQFENPVDFSSGVSPFGTILNVKMTGGTAEAPAGGGAGTWAVTGFTPEP